MIQLISGFYIDLYENQPSRYLQQIKPSKRILIQDITRGKVHNRAYDNTYENLYYSPFIDNLYGEFTSNKDIFKTVKDIKIFSKKLTLLLDSKPPAKYILHILNNGQYTNTHLLFLKDLVESLKPCPCHQQPISNLKRYFGLLGPDNCLSTHNPLQSNDTVYPIKNMLERLTTYTVADMIVFLAGFEYGLDTLLTALKILFGRPDMSVT